MNIRNRLVLILLISAGLAAGPAAAQSDAGTAPGAAPGAPPAAEPTAGRPTASQTAEDPPPEVRPDLGIHAAFDALLHDFVHDGVVDYTGLSKQRSRLRGYLGTLATVSPKSLDRDERLAFWINAYNAFTLELILDHLGTIDSIKDISSGKRWKDERWLVEERRYSLDGIEHEILRPMGEPRIHFALVCASFSCPDLRPEAYLPASLDAQLDVATGDFLADREKGLRTGMDKGFFGGETPTLYLSKIFDWFEEDFEKDGDVVDFVRRHAPADAVVFIDRYRDDLDVESLSYDWSLNGR